MVTIETSFRFTDHTWLRLLPFIILPILIANFAICQLVRSAESFFGAFIVFSLCNIVLRIMSTYLILHESVKRGTWVALGFVLLANASKMFIV